MEYYSRIEFRLAFYKDLLNISLKQKPENFFLCTTIWFLMPCDRGKIDSIKRIERVFVELFNQAPAGVEENDAWYNDDQNGYDKRIQHIRNAISDCEKQIASNNNLLL